MGYGLRMEWKVIGWEIEAGGKGYYNLDSSNIPSTEIPLEPGSPLGGEEVDASLAVRLGGSLKLTGTNDLLYPHKDSNNKVGNKDVWIEIWDLDRDETQIDENDSRAMAVAKVENGEIKKVVVVKKGGDRNQLPLGGGPPKDLGNYDFSTTTFSKGDLYNSNIIKKTCGQKKYTRYWRCTNVRETLGGRFVRCGHTEVGLYPPEKCPGEATADSKLTEERTPETVGAWKRAHMGTCHYLCESTNFFQGPPLRFG